jgi:molybdate transport repressor ModE-like protein
MHRRYERFNLPIEIVRTLVTIAETGSFSKAGDKLGLSQPAISAQVKRLQILVGAHIFERTPGGVTLTEVGKLVLAQARKLLEANDQIFLLGGAASDPQPLRLGLTTFYIEDFLNLTRSGLRYDQVGIHCGPSLDLARVFADGYLDVVCVLSAPKELGRLAAEWQEDFVWIRDRNFVLSPGAPIPLVCRPGSPADQLTMEALEKANLTYRVAFTSSDLLARRSAVAAGIGIMALPERFISETLVMAKEHYLPPLMPIRASIWVRPGVPMTKADPVVKLLAQLAPGTKRNAA